MRMIVQSFNTTTWQEKKLSIIRILNFFVFDHLKAEISSKICKNCEERVKQVEKSYWKTDRTMDTKLDKLQIALEVKDNKDDNSDSTEEKKDG